MKSAVEYLVKEFSDILGVLNTTPMQDLLLVDAFNKAKDMEKENNIFPVNNAKCSHKRISNCRGIVWCKDCKENFSKPI